MSMLILSTEINARPKIMTPLDETPLEASPEGHNHMTFKIPVLGSIIEWAHLHFTYLQSPEMT
jgi:hypothetical protein